MSRLIRVLFCLGLTVAAVWVHLEYCAWSYGSPLREATGTEVPGRLALLYEWSGETGGNEIGLYVRREPDPAQGENWAAMERDALIWGLILPLVLLLAAVIGGFRRSRRGPRAKEPALLLALGERADRGKRRRRGTGTRG